MSLTEFRNRCAPRALKQPRSGGAEQDAHGRKLPFFVDPI
jgi:hypothetical protein